VQSCVPHPSLSPQLSGLRPCSRLFRRKTQSIPSPSQLVNWDTRMATRFSLVSTQHSLSGQGTCLLTRTPGTLTKTSMIEACTNQSSRTVLQVYETVPPKVPLCGNPFTLDGYSGLELLCADGTSIEASQVTAIATNGTQTHNCTRLPQMVYSTRCHPPYGADSIWQLFACQ
jgi:hypothetical protein